MKTEIINFTIEQKEVMDKAISKYGDLSQRIKTNEELAELIVSISKRMEYFWLKTDRDYESDIRQSVIEEIADVLIMLYQTIEIENCEKEVYDVINMKISRLEERILK